MFVEPKRRELRPEVLGQAMQQAALYDPTTTAVARTYAEEATIGVGTLKADITAFNVEEAQRTGSPITADEYNNSDELRSEGVSWHDGMTRESALISKEFNDAARKRSQILSDASTSQSVAGFAVGFGAGIFEPKNLAVGVAASLALPVLGTVGFLGKTGQNIYRIRKTATLGQRVLMGGAEGIVAGAAVEPSNRYSAKVLQQDYTMMDSVFNIATSTAFGAGMPVAAKGISKAGPFMQEKINKFRGRTMDVVLAEHDLAVQQFTQGQRVDVSAVEAVEIGSVAKKPVAQQVRAAEAFVRTTEAPEFKAKFEGSKGVDADGKPKMLFHGTSKSFDQFSTGVGEAIFFSDSPNTANSYATSPEYSSAPNIRPAYLNTKNPLEIDANGSDWHSIDFMGEVMDADSIAVYAKNKGHDGLIIKNVVDDMNAEGRYGNTTYAVFSPDQVIPVFGDKSLPDIIAQADTANTQTLTKAQADALDPANDTLIDYSAIDAADERRAIQSVEGEAEAEAYFQEAEAEIRQMLADDILNEADLAEYRDALETLQSREPVNALETLKLCLTRG